MTDAFRLAVRRFCTLLLDSPTLTAYREGRRQVPPRPHHGAWPDGRWLRSVDQAPEIEPEDPDSTN